MTSSYCFLNGMRMHYLYWGLENEGRTVILLHGLASNARIWELTAPHLVKADMQVLALEARGHGLSDKPQEDYSFKSLCSDLGAFIEASQVERPILVGHSWGAGIALDYAARIPIGPYAPAGIVLVDGGMTQLDDLPEATWASVSERLAPPQLSGTPVEEFIQRVKEANTHWHPSEEAISIILANFEIGEDETIIPRLSRERHMRILREMWEFKTFERFQFVKCPALLIPARPAEPMGEGEREYLASKERGVERVRQVLPGLRVQWMEDSIHDIPLQRPEALAKQILDFARSVHPTRK